MKITVTPIPIPFGAFELKIREPGVVRYVAFKLEEKLLLTAARGGKPEFDEIPAMFVEVSTDGPLHNRRFIAIRDGQLLEPKETQRAVWCGTGISGATGTIVHVFEMREVDA